MAWKGSDETGTQLAHSRNGVVDNCAQSGAFSAQRALRSHSGPARIALRRGDDLAERGEAGELLGLELGGQGGCSGRDGRAVGPGTGPEDEPPASPAERCAQLDGDRRIGER